MNGLSERRRERVRELIEQWWGLRPVPITRRTTLAQIALSSGALGVALIVLASVTQPVRAPAAPAPLPNEAQEDPAMRFGIPLVERRIIFSELVANEPAARIHARDTFPGELWSQEDDRAAGERDAARSLAEKRGINVSIVYAILDEGVRARWPDKDDVPLDAHIVPLKPRRR
ncbi:MAG: hypothetical protein JWM74_4908 [Myxococcaceae bacterium]|nr:hypothetical protein [Myxococcaceae bacterium]